jgi:predicted DsbA family dithiol-disulfide isomerase
MSESGPRFFFDYVDPGSYLMEIRVTRAAADAGVAVERVPYEVRPPPEPLLAPGDAAWTEYWNAMARELEAERLAVRRPGLVPWTRKAHELLQHAREHEREGDVHRALFRRFLVEGEDIGRVDVLLAVATAAGLDPTETKAVLDVDRHAAGVGEARALGQRMGVRGVPTLTTEGRILEGIHGEGDIGAFLSGKRPSAAE